MNVFQMLYDFARPNRYKLVDKYILRDGKTHPLAILCPGGGHTMVCSFAEGVPFAKKLNEMGISAAIVYYRVRKKAAYPAVQEDLAKAVKTLLDNSEKYPVDPASYSVWGSSAGGHLAASFGTETMGYKNYGLPAPACLVLAYPVISMHKELTYKQSRKYFIGENADEKRESFASIDENVTASYPKTYLWCGDADRTVPPENSKRMDAALTKANVRHRFRIFPGVGHGLGLAAGTSAEGWIEEAAAFWLETE